MTTAERFSIRRPLMVFLVAALFTAGTWRLGTADPSAANDPIESATPADKDPHDVGEIEDLSSQVLINVLKTLRTQGRLEHFLAITLTNSSSEAISGPLAVVVDSTGVEGLTLSKSDGELDPGELFVEIVPAKSELKPGQTTQPHRIDFTSLEAISQAQREQFTLSCRVLRAGKSEQEPTDDKVKESRQTRSSEPLLPGKSYSQGTLNRVMRVQEKWHPQFNKNESVYGTGTAEDDDGNLVVRVYATRSGVKNEIPKQVDGIPVHVVTGDVFRAGPAWTGVVRQNGRKVAVNQDAETSSTESTLLPIPDSQADGGPNGGTDAASDKTVEDHGNSTKLPTAVELSGQTGLPTIRFNRPVPIGVSAFNIDDPVCAAGTLGCRCVDANGTLYALSNNHVFAAENLGMIGNVIVQPGPLDVNCLSDRILDRVGTLSDFEPLVQANNLMDAAIIRIDDGAVDACTPDDGYGFPSNLTAQPFLGQNVRKHGRTTGATSGRITAINVMATVSYTTIVSDFINCIEIAHSDINNPFGGPGDSGSLIVTDPDRRPVGLLFAGTPSKTLASPIGPVLARFGVQLDDGTGLVPPARPPRIGFAIPGSN